MCIFKVLKAECIKLGHISFLRVLRGGELKSVVCPAENARYCQKIEICVYVHIILTKQGRNFNEMFFCRF